MPTSPIPPGPQQQAADHAGLAEQIYEAVEKDFKDKLPKAATLKRQPCIELLQSLVGNGAGCEQATAEFLVRVNAEPQKYLAIEEPRKTVHSSAPRTGTSDYASLARSSAPSSSSVDRAMLSSRSLHQNAWVVATESRAARIFEVMDGAIKSQVPGVALRREACIELLHVLEGHGYGEQQLITVFLSKVNADQAKYLRLVNSRGPPQSSAPSAASSPSGSSPPVSSKKWWRFWK